MHYWLINWNAKWPTGWNPSTGTSKDCWAQLWLLDHGLSLPGRWTHLRERSWSRVKSELLQYIIVCGHGGRGLHPMPARRHLLTIT